MWNCFISASCFCSAERGKEVSAVCGLWRQQWLVGRGVWGATRCESLPYGLSQVSNEHTCITQLLLTIRGTDYSACEMFSSLDVRRLFIFHLLGTKKHAYKWGKTDRMGPNVHVLALCSASRVFWESEKLWALLKWVFFHQNWKPNSAT